jgi:hypothetical protein
MKLEKELDIPLGESAVRSRTASYFQEAGYRLVREEGNLLEFRRGSRLGSWIPLNPAHLKCTATVTLEPRGNQTHVKAEFDLAALFKDETRFTDEFWKNEIREFENALLKGEYVSLKSKNLTRRAFLKNLVYVFSGLIWVFIWGAISFLLILPAIFIGRAVNIQPDIAWIVALLIMVIAFLITRQINKFWKRRQEQPAETKRKKSSRRTR